MGGRDRVRQDTQRARRVLRPAIAGVAPSTRRFQGDAQWQRDFFRLIQARVEQHEHVIAGHQLLEHGVPDEAREQLDCADELQEEIDLLEHALRDL